ncbi:CCA tRNA nucleotidyltransferase [Malassezia arunalokei]|uniref:CCA tRNA nucleotidyltransferase n=1 Tax=Malassezia arunalokei TaxID=1514897 RepID=A0AAJ5Z4P6_9BASI|nr:CCA tRNA nucleotidyltransferase [Malassezia arunalokei]
MPPSVTLTREEGFLCTLLDDTCRWMQTTNPSVDVDGTSRTYADLCHRPTATTPCEARIAGGWVRDKLLGLPSHDLDVSLSSMTGHHFALFLKAYLESEVFPRTPLAREMQEAAPSHARISHIGKIAANPEQSKNLETATARVLGFDLDFVNLRKEVYEGTHRIPIMSFGTPLEDAMRRDMTVNALFYNVHTAAIEDWTQHGLADLRDGIVRTPMDPTATFTDDPLRILRCVRFGSRFGYAIHPDILAALAVPASPLHAALASKVSRERVGIEVDKMLSGRDPRYALQLLSQLQLYWVVFMPPPALSQRMGRSSDHGAHIDELVHDAPDERAALSLSDSFDSLLRDTSPLWSRLPADWLARVRAPDWSAQRRLVWYAIALLPLRDLYVQAKKQPAWAGAVTISAGLKLGHRTTKDPVTSLVRAASLLSRPRLARFVPAPCLTRRSTIGLLLRHHDVSQPKMDVALDNALLVALLYDLATYAHGLDTPEAEAIVDEHAAFWARSSMDAKSRRRSAATCAC